MSSPPRDRFGNISGLAAPMIWDTVEEFKTPRVNDINMEQPFGGPNTGYMRKSTGSRPMPTQITSRPQMGSSPFADTFRKDLESMRSNPAFMSGLSDMRQKYLSQIANPSAITRAKAESPQRSVIDIMSEQRQQQRNAMPIDPQRRMMSRGIAPVQARRGIPPVQEAQGNFPIPQEALDQLRRDSNVGVAPQMPQEASPNPFEGNEQYQALMEYQKSMQPQQEQMDRMNELRTAFEGTGGFKDYRIKQMEQQLQQRQQMGLGGQRPTGMGMFGGFPQRSQFPQRPTRIPQGIMSGFGRQNMQRPQQNFGYGGMQRPQQSMNYSGYGQQPQQNSYQQYGMQGGGYQQSPYQQPYPQPQQYGGYGMSQNYGGQGGYSPMQNQYQPQQYGNSNNFSGYGQQQAQQFY